MYFILLCLYCLITERVKWIEQRTLLLMGGVLLLYNKAHGSSHEHSVVYLNLIIISNTE